MGCGRFEKAYIKYRDYIARFVYDKIHDYDVADDIAHDVFLAFYQNMFKVAPELEKAWLYRSAKNRTIDYIRMMNRRTQISLEAGILETELWQLSDNIKTLEKHLDNEALLKKIMGELKEKNRAWYDALRLFCVEELTYEEAAGRLNVSVGVLRSRVCRARAYVRDRYGEEFYQEN
ncbi:MAG: RNA polymerase sigma factor [Clostridiales bacterium]|nr:RNA polymerase sigma factor [Clostridiales bacterium]